MTEFSLFDGDLDLAGNDEIQQNNVCVAQESLDDEPKVQADDDMNSPVYNLLRGRAVERKKVSAKNDDAKLFKLLSLNELEQAIVNISYYYDIRNLIPESALGSFKISGLEEAGLSYNPETYIIEGVPNHLGTFQVSLQFNIKGSPFSKLMNLNVITLWKDVDPPEDLIFPKSNTDSASLIVDTYRKRGLKNVVAASVRGRSHAYDGKPRDDDFKIMFDENSGWYVCAVADGAGSAKYSREGSRILVEQIEAVFNEVFASSTFDEEVQSIARQYLKDCDDTSFYRHATQVMVPHLLKVVDSTLKRFEQQVATMEKARLYDFSTTCLISVFKKIKHDWVIFTYNVGDGAISMINDKGNYAAILCNPDEGKYFGETRFITTDGINTYEDVKNRILVNLVHDFDALVMMTDGVSDPKFESDRNLHDSRKWLDFYRQLTTEVSLYGCNDEIEAQLLKYLEFWSIGNHDDRTLVIVF